MTSRFSTAAASVFLASLLAAPIASAEEKAEPTGFMLFGWFGGLVPPASAAVAPEAETVKAPVPAAKPKIPASTAAAPRKPDMKSWVSQPEDRASLAPRTVSLFSFGVEADDGTGTSAPPPAAKPAAPAAKIETPPATPTRVAAVGRLPAAPYVAGPQPGLPSRATTLHPVKKGNMKTWVSRPNPQAAPRPVVPGVDPKFLKAEVSYQTKEPAGTIVVDTASRYLYLVKADGKAIRYGIGVGRQGFTWKGTARVGHKAEWPDWHPPATMRAREPWLPVRMEGGPDNPLGARALYLFQGDKDTLYRIHGTNQPTTIGQAVSSGCIRMLNDDVSDLYERIGNGTRVVVL